MFEFFERTLILTLFLVTSSHFSDAFKRGAPALACSTMTPSHGHATQTTRAPYNVSLILPDLGNGQMRIRLTSGNPNVYFTGFMLRDKAFSVNGEEVSNLHGTFVSVPQDASIFDCSGSKASAVTHKSDAKKRSVEVDYQPPKNFDGSVVLRATFVYNYTTFWTDVDSAPIQVGTRNARQFPPSGNNFNNDRQLNSLLLSVYNGCGQSKNCLTSPENCLSSRSCDGVVAVTGGSRAYEIEMFAKRGKYVAVGFSEDASMGSDFVFECVDRGNTVQAHQSWNEANRKANTRLEDSDDFSLVSGSVVDGTIYCKIRINSLVQYSNRRLDLNNEQYYLFLASGTSADEKGPGVGFHNNFFVSSKVRRYLNDVTSEPVQDSFYSGCNAVKTCFGLPEDCVERQNCNYVTSVAVQGNRFIINMKAKSGAYVATALSEDQQMNSDHVVECILNGDKVEAYSSWNTPNRHDNIRLGSDGVELIEGDYKEGYITCRVSYDPSVIQGFRFDQNYYLMLASGASLNTEKIGFHNLAYRTSSKQVTMPSAAKSESFYQGCDRSKSCFGLPAGCVAQMNCKNGVAMSSEFGGRFIFHMIAEGSPAYVAVGLSTDEKMGEDVVFECVREDASGSVVRAYMSYNVPGDKANDRLPTPNYLVLLNSSYVDGKLQCAIQLDNPTFNVKGKSYNLVKDQYVLLLAAGSSATPATSGSRGKIDYHDLARSAAGERRALADVSAIRGASKLLLYLHGSFMIASWIGLASLGIVLARYYKQTWVGGSCCGKDHWFFWHRLCMFLTVVLTIAGSVLMYIYNGGFVKGPGETHALLGFITAVLAFLQPIGALFRPHPDSSRRPIFNWLHWLIGNTAHVVAIVTIFFAVDLGKAELPKWTDWILVTFVAYYVTIHLILSISGCMADKSGSMRITAMQMKDMNTGRNMPHQYERRKDAPQSCTRKFLLFLHFLIIVAFTVLLIFLVVYAPVKFN